VRVVEDEAAAEKLLDRKASLAKPASSMTEIKRHMATAFLLISSSSAL
jgi:hypothetical protein